VWGEGSGGLREKRAVRAVWGHYFVDIEEVMW